MGSPGTVSPTTANLPDFMKARDIFAGGASPAPTNFGHVFPATGPQVEVVDLFDFNFLGKRFAPHRYKEIAADDTVTIREVRGVSRPMAERMIRAQEEIFRLFLARRSVALDKVDAAKPVTEAEFDDFCGIKAGHGGWGFRKGKHSVGCAVDIDTNLNPYVATRTRTGANDVFGGELGAFAEASKAAKVPLLQANVFKPAVEVYDRAASLLFGSPGGIAAAAEVGHFGKGSNPNETFEDAWARFYRAHRALEFYFSFAFTRVPLNKQASLSAADPHNQGVPIEQFRERFLDKFADSNFQAAHPEIVSAMNADQEGFLQKTRQQMIDDHALVRRVMVTGNLNVAKAEDADAFAKASADQSRDPCYGFLSHRKETVVGLCSAGIGGLRWGACQFSERANGDIMHFDMGEGFRPAGIRTITVPAGTRFEKIKGGG